MIIFLSGSIFGFLFFTSDLKRTAPITFWCRETTFQVNYTVKSPDVPATTPPPSITEIPKTKLIKYEEKPDVKNRKPNIDPLKKIIMKVLSECHYFKILEEDSPVQFNSLKEKLRYFHPGFHSTTPSGFKSHVPSSKLKLTSLMIILECQKSPTLSTQIGGGPNVVFLAFISLSSEIPFIGIVSPGLIHCCKNVKREFNPSGVVE